MFHSFWSEIAGLIKKNLALAVRETIPSLMFSKSFTIEKIEIADTATTYSKLTVTKSFLITKESVAQLLEILWKVRVSLKKCCHKKLKCIHIKKQHNKQNNNNERLRKRNVKTFKKTDEYWHIHCKFLILIMRKINSKQARIYLFWVKKVYLSQ